MFKQSLKLKTISCFLLAGLFALPVASQSKKGIKGAVQPLSVTILEVVKEDAKARANSTGKGRVIPVHLEWRVGEQEGVKLVELEAMLTTTNTDGSTTKVKKMLDPGTRAGDLILEMPDGVFAKQYQLTMVAKCAWDGGGGSSRASKSGSFPVPATR